jgi:uncharacterized protein with GYD domain
MEAEDATSDIEIVDTYALLGRYDFLLVFEGPRSRWGLRTLAGR